jgi:hypothetical protein
MKKAWFSILMLLTIAACGKPGGGHDVATAGGTPAASPSASAGTLQQAIAYAACMRAHGIPQWPDPEVDGGGVRIRAVDKGSVDATVLATAIRACAAQRPVLPGPDMALKLDSARFESRCMREQGVENYPDPEPDAHVELPQSVRDDPQFERAKAICREKTRSYEPSPAATR